MTSHLVLSTFPEPKFYSPEDDAALRRMIDARWSAGMAATVLNRSRNSVIGRALRIGLAFHSGRKHASRAPGVADRTKFPTTGLNLPSTTRLVPRTVACGSTAETAYVPVSVPRLSFLDGPA